MSTFVHPLKINASAGRSLSFSLSVSGNQNGKRAQEPESPSSPASLPSAAKKRKGADAPSSSTQPPSQSLSQTLNGFHSSGHSNGLNGHATNGNGKGNCNGKRKVSVSSSSEDEAEEQEEEEADEEAAAGAGTERLSTMAPIVAAAADTSDNSDSAATPLTLLSSSSATSVSSSSSSEAKRGSASASGSLAKSQPTPRRSYASDTFDPRSFVTQSRSADALAVPTWEDPEVDQVLEQREALKQANRHIFRPVRKHRDKWDMELDRGKTKKVKSKHKGALSFSTANGNGFQALQNRRIKPMSKPRLAPTSLPSDL